MLPRAIGLAARRGESGERGSLEAIASERERVPWRAMFPFSPSFASRPARVGALSLSLSLSLALGACSAAPDEVRWFVRFAGGMAPAGVVSVHTEVRTGWCGGPARFADEIAASEGVGTSPGALAHIGDR